MKVAIAQKIPDKNGRRLVAFYDDRWLVHDYAAKELSFRPGYRVPAVVCFEHAGELSGWKPKHIIFDPNYFAPGLILLEDFLHPWIEAGIRLAASDFQMKPMRGYDAIELSLGKHEKVLRHLVWQRWPIWQREAHREKMKDLNLKVSAGAYEDLIAAFPKKFMKRVVSVAQVKDACNRLGLPIRLSI